MIRRNSHQFAKSHMLVSVALLAIGLVASTAVPALAQTSGTWATTGSMKTARCCQTATLLQNGQVLVAGGFNGNVLASAWRITYAFCGEKGHFSLAYLGQKKKPNSDCTNATTVPDSCTSCGPPVSSRR